MESKNQKFFISYRFRKSLGKTHFSDAGIIGIIKQRLEDVELQRWFSEMNNDDTRKDPNQSNKMRTYRKVKK